MPLMININIFSLLDWSIQLFFPFLIVTKRNRSMYDVIFVPQRKRNYPSIFYNTSSILCRGGADAYLQQSTGERRDTPWTGHQSIAGQHRDTQDKQPCTQPFTPKGKLERPINQLTVMFLDCGGKPEYPGENPCMQREIMQTLCRKTPGRDSIRGPSCCKATVLPTGPPCSKKELMDD
ncbi:hypothetical protein ILYODFUR_000795 [Ilyodon furcidens]|uniref:Uncharacterized protein n=1 Tax=Ilyodon furcidens TaxID=33524 RepID=A0ABV0UG96_9TELE